MQLPDTVALVLIETCFRIAGSFPQRYLITSGVSLATHQNQVDCFSLPHISAKVLSRGKFANDIKISSAACHNAADADKQPQYILKWPHKDRIILTPRSRRLIVQPEPFQRIIASLPLRVYQATVTQLDRPLDLEVHAGRNVRRAGDVPGIAEPDPERGGVRISRKIFSANSLSVRRIWPLFTA